MYLFYFEQVLQQASGDPNLRLPFWDYETDGHIPAAYRSPTYVDGGVTKPNPLYVANRQAQLNAGTAALTPAVTSTAGALPSTTYSPFNSALEQTPHGSVHCATGVASCPSGYMGYVPSAGNDPIFYSHHANIDRLYECWLRVNPTARLPNNAAQLAQHFSFIDGGGTLVSSKVGDMLTPATPLSLCIGRRLPAHHQIPANLCAVGKALSRVSAERPYQTATRHHHGAAQDCARVPQADADRAGTEGPGVALDAGDRRAEL